VVTLGGRDVYLGPWNSSASRQAYDQVIAEWLAQGRQHPVASIDLTIDDMLARHWLFAEQHYRKNGEPTGELANIRYALRPLQKLYGSTAAAAFGPLKLKAVREQMVLDGLSRRLINQRIGIIRRVFRWAASEELVPSSVVHGLSAVAGFQKGRSAARETSPVQPVPEATVQATLSFLPPVVRAMVQFQQLTGCRPGEVRTIRPQDVDRSSSVWQYRPARHKTEHWDHARVILIGPKAQEVLAPYLNRRPDAYCFSPAESEVVRAAERRRLRKTRVQPSQVDRSKPCAMKRPGKLYSRVSYQRAITRACDRADVPHWTPNQLRHLAATKIRAAYGLEAAQVILGHSKADVTQIYAARDLEKARSIIAQAG
jgi:integrase